VDDGEATTMMMVVMVMKQHNKQEGNNKTHRKSINSQVTIEHLK
jgi:hypothetical protein